MDTETGEIKHGVDMQGRKRADLGVHLHEQPTIADDMTIGGKISQRGELKTNPAKILGEKVQGTLLGVTVDTDNQTIAGEAVDGAELQKSHQTTIGISE